MVKPTNVRLGAAHNTVLDAMILVDQTRMTLYHFTSEKGKKLACKGSCVKFWPPLLLKPGAKPTAGKGVAKAKVGTIRRPDGRLQVTYAGFALYRYVGDLKPGDTNGQGVQKIWFVVSPSGRVLKKALG